MLISDNNILIHTCQVSCIKACKLYKLSVALRYRHEIKRFIKFFCILYHLYMAYIIRYLVRKMISILPQVKGLQHPRKVENRQEKRVKSKFNKAWKKQYLFINKVRNDQHSLYCTVCKRNVKCGHMAISDVQWHITTSMHQRFAKDARSQTILSFPSLSSPVSEKVND